jgi:hypothetical protein
MEAHKNILIREIIRYELLLEGCDLPYKSPPAAVRWCLLQKYVAKCEIKTEMKD